MKSVDQGMIRSGRPRRKKEREQRLRKYSMKQKEQLRWRATRALTI
jgi:hypothetical protein